MPMQQPRRRFQYQKRDEAKLKAQAERSGGDYDKVLNDHYPSFKTTEGARCIRVMPPTWEGAEHFAYKIWWHRNVGVDGGTYLCPHKMIDGATCVICDERARAQREGDDEEYIKSLKPVERAVFVLIDRDKQSEGPLIWACPWMTEREIAGLCVGTRGRPTRWLDDPENGFDLDFTIKGVKRDMRVISLAIAPEPTPLSDDERQQESWLQFVADHPIPDCLIWHDQAKIATALAGGPPPRDAPAAAPATRGERCRPAEGGTERYAEEPPRRPVRGGELPPDERYVDGGEDNLPEDGEGAYVDDGAPAEPPLDEPPPRRTAPVRPRMGPPGGSAAPPRVEGRSGGFAPLPPSRPRTSPPTAPARQAPAQPARPAMRPPAQGRPRMAPPPSRPRQDDGFTEADIPY